MIVTFIVRKNKERKHCHFSQRRKERLAFGLGLGNSLQEKIALGPHIVQSF